MSVERMDVRSGKVSVLPEDRKLDMYGWDEDVLKLIIWKKPV